MYIHVHVQVHLYRSVHGLEGHSPHYLLRLPNRYRYSLQKKQKQKKQEKTNNKKKELSSGVVACICLVSINDHTCRSKHRGIGYLHVHVFSGDTSPDEASNYCVDRIWEPLANP